MLPLLVVITGPTAVGKTALCVELAKHFNTEIISADSRQFYRELSIGTAKPSPEEMQGVPHHFIDHLSISDTYTVNDFEQEAIRLIQRRFEDQNILILTGGSGLFIDALCHGFDEDLPAGDDTIRNELEALYEKYGITILQEKLKQLDPYFYQEIDLDNVKRLYRAIEVCLLSDKPYSEIRKGERQKRPFKILKIVLNRDREELYGRINQRVDLMIEQGLEKEVRGVLPYRDKNALKTVGYRELFDYFDGRCSFGDAVEKIKVNSRRYAKKQLTWFKKDEDYHWYHPDQKEDLIQLISFNIN
ncbi:MAG: tRNA (adenosine(37)-N6)-dimethylallyltransferase MiaA [Flavobacteriales bacterium]|nr:tRNA (adenosine(37)-N6)-dimethylallyltransferase MiaA [Flavobacteriales bacterium]